MEGVGEKSIEGRHNDFGLREVHFYLDFYTTQIKLDFLYVAACGHTPLYTPLSPWWYGGSGNGCNTNLVSNKCIVAWKNVLW